VKHDTKVTGVLFGAFLPLIDEVQEESLVVNFLQDFHRVHQEIQVWEECQIPQDVKGPLASEGNDCLAHHTVKERKRQDSFAYLTKKRKEKKKGNLIRGALRVVFRRTSIPFS